MDMEICLQKFCVFFNIIRWLRQNHNGFYLAINSAILFSILPITSYSTCFERYVYIQEHDDVINFMLIPVWMFPKQGCWRCSKVAHRKHPCS